MLFNLLAGGGEETPAEGNHQEEKLRDQNFTWGFVWDGEGALRQGEKTAVYPDQSSESHFTNIAGGPTFQSKQRLPQNGTIHYII